VHKRCSSAVGSLYRASCQAAVAITWHTCARRRAGSLHDPYLMQPLGVGVKSAAESHFWPNTRVFRVIQKIAKRTQHVYARCGDGSLDGE
jgi:hypothetical protein